MRILLILLFLLSLFSCHRPSPTGNIFRYNESAGVSTLDPAFARSQAVMWPVTQLYSTLVEVDDSMRIKPLLAKSWKLSTDKLSITFQLRTDVFFHDDPAFSGGKGRRLQADDVVYSFRRLMQPALASPGAWVFHSRVDSLMPFVAINDSVFQLRLSKPFIPMLGILSMPYCSIIPHEAPEKYGSDFRKHPVGTGPFQMKVWQENQALILKKNPGYFEKDETGNRLPYLEGVMISFHPAKSTEFMEFRQNRLDMINDLDPSYRDAILTKKGKLRSAWEGKLQLITCPYLNTEYLGILMDTSNALIQHSPLRSVNFRKALNHSIDRERLVLYMRNSIGYPAVHGFVPPGMFSKEKGINGYTFDTSLARKYLNKSDYRAGFSPPVKLYSVPAYAQIASYLAAEWEKMGIAVEAEIVPKSRLLDLTSKSGVCFFRGSWIADYPDPENYFSVFYSDNPAPPNYTRFRDPGYDSLYSLTVMEEMDAVRNRHYMDMEKIIADKAPVIPLWYDMVAQLLQPAVMGYRANSRNMLDLRRVRKSY
jgi:ABC-type transport system substrate-binding protein